LRMCSLYPAQVIKSSNFLGRIAPGYNADVVILNKELGATGLIR